MVIANFLIKMCIRDSMYPVLTTLIMMLFFKEKKSGWRIAAIASAVAGVYFLSGGDTKTGSFSFLGLFIVLLSALGYALYLVTMSQLKICLLYTSRRAIEEMGYENPMPVQEEVIPYLLGENNDVVALAQTGTCLLYTSQK